MIKIVFSFLLVFFTVSWGTAQTTKISYPPPPNGSCATAIQICQTDSMYQNCPTNVPWPKIYYFVHCSTTNASGPLLTIGAQTSSTIKVFGAYNSLTEGCEAFNSLPSPLQTLTGISNTISLPTVAGQYYLIEVTMTCNERLKWTPVAGKLDCNVSIEPPTCEDCIGSLQLTKGTYVFSGWAMEGGALATKTTYTYPRVTINVAGTNSYPTLMGDIIDGWQRIEGTFTLTADGQSLLVTLGSLNGSVYYDDLRIYPVDGSMMSYVYDPLTLRLVAELDERNYAKFYDYDEEGKLIRVEKETEKGIFTITETRENSSGKP